MPRKKKFLSLPFAKKFKIKQNTFANIIGLLIAGLAVIILVSFIQSGAVLTRIFNETNMRFGILSVVFPIILLLFSSHFFSSKKLKFVKPHVTFGTLLIFVAVLGLFSSGQIGSAISNNFKTDFSPIGAYIILFVTFIIGIILFFNTSVDVFLLMVINVVKQLFTLLSGILQKKDGENVKEATDENQNKKDEFIRGEPVAKPVIVSKAQVTGKSGDIHIRPITNGSGEDWAYPPASLLEEIKDQKADAGDIAKNSDIIERTLDSFGIRARVAEINQGPTVTQYALEIVMGIKLSKITGLSNDLALALAAPTGQVRIEAPIPGRALVGIEIPNRKSEIVTLKRLLASENLINNPHPLAVPIGLDVGGRPEIGNLAAMPHVLIAGTTGSGKSVMLNAWICSILFRARPQEVRLILVDPKRVELTSYNGVPHLLTEVIVEPDKIISALKWTIGEMERRYKDFQQVGARNIESYNGKPGVEHLPYIVFVIDELADLMIYAPAEAEQSITRIAQMARATGIHLILATQRPSVDVITGLMKANIPSRIAFNVPSLIDSRVVLILPETKLPSASNAAAAKSVSV
jgi:S-DNA-T family DNA segregation ATPase FtsK/SpoIIIE